MTRGTGWEADCLSILSLAYFRQADYNGIKANFGGLLAGVNTQVEGIAQEIAAEDMKAGINPQEDPRMGVFGQLNTAVANISAAQTPGHDRLHRTNDVIGIGVSASF